LFDFACVVNNKPTQRSSYHPTFLKITHNFANNILTMKNPCIVWKHISKEEKNMFSLDNMDYT